jgi:hypothetical protein
VVHVRAWDGCDRPGATTGAPPWFMCGHGSVVPDASVRCDWARGAVYDAGGRRV